jgi:hypothetical protein
MTTNLSLISYSTKRYPVKLAVESFSNRLTQGRLSNTGWSIEAEDSALVVFCQLSNCQELNNSLLDFLESVVVFIEHFLGFGRIQIFFLADVPWQFRNRVQVVHAHMILLVPRTKLAQFSQFTITNFFCLFRKI